MDFSKSVPKSSEYDIEGTLLHFLRELELSLRMSYDSFEELKVNSAYRSTEYEIRMGRSGSSSHCLGKAVDIHCTNNSHRYHIIKYAMSHGVNRIGVYKTFIHLDIATYKDHKTEFVIWYG